MITTGRPDLFPVPPPQPGLGPARTPRRPPRHTRAEISQFAQVRRAEEQYATSLRRIARTVGDFIKGLFPGGRPAHDDALAQLTAGLAGYAEVLTPWAEAVARRMVVDVSQRDERAWARLGDRMSRALHREMTTTPLGSVVRERLATQVMLIKSLPLEAARRVQNLTIEQRVVGGGRAKDLVDEIMRSGEVTRNRAVLIARTETGRTATEFVRARAEHLGSTHFIWRTAKDRDVRKEHRQLEGRPFRWDDPPVAEASGARHLPGAFPNCRCWAEPVVPDYV